MLLLTLCSEVACCESGLLIHVLLSNIDTMTNTSIAQTQRHSNAHHLIHLCSLDGEIGMADALRKERLECVLSSGFV